MVNLYKQSAEQSLTIKTSSFQVFTVGGVLALTSLFITPIFTVGDVFTLTLSIYYP